MSSRPALTVVGTGIRCGTDLSPNVRRALSEADEVFFLASDLLSRNMLVRLRPDAISLAEFYGYEVERSETYAAIVERVLESVRAGRKTCFAIPGHPGVFAQPTHEAIRRARAEGFTALMIPALSAADHLYADLGVDPGEAGLQNYEATNFIIYGRRPDPTITLILWQIGAIGETRNPREVSRSGLRVLTDVLLETYAPSHEVVVYEAARYAICAPTIVRTPLDALPDAPVTLMGTLYVPPAELPTLVPERVALLRLSVEGPRHASTERVDKPR